MDTQNSKKGKKGLWIKIVAAVVIVGALVTVGVLGMQGDWLQGRTKLSMLKEQPKTTATTKKVPITTPTTKVPTTTNAVVSIISDPMAFDGQNITVTHPATITFKPSTEKNGSWSWKSELISLNCQLTYNPEKVTCTTINPKEPTYNTIRYQWQEGAVTKRAANEIKILVKPQALLNPTEITIPVDVLDVPPPLTVEDERPPLTVPVTITSNPPATDNQGQSEVILTYPETITITRSKLPLDTVATEWGYNENYFTCILLPVVGSDIEKLECTPKTPTADGVYSGIGFSWCVTGNVCQWSNKIFVRVLPALPGGLEPQPSQPIQ